MDWCAVACGKVPPLRWGARTQDRYRLGEDKGKRDKPTTYQRTLRRSPTSHSRTGNHILILSIRSFPNGPLFARSVQRVQGEGAKLSLNPL